jgi:hypothetical protein
MSPQQPAKAKFRGGEMQRTVKWRFAVSAGDSLVIKSEKF